MITPKILNSCFIAIYFRIVKKQEQNYTLFLLNAISKTYKKPSIQGLPQMDGISTVCFQGFLRFSTTN